MDKWWYSSDSEFHNVTITTNFVLISATTSSLSLAGTLLIFITYFTWKEIRISSRRILVYISVADFLTALGNMFSVIKGSESSESVALCEIQSFVTTTSTLCSFFWSTFMAVYLYVAVALRKPVLAEKLLCAFHVFAWGVPFAISGTALGLDKLGNGHDVFTAGWCWIKDTEDQLQWMWVTGKAWELLTYVLIVVFYSALKWRIHQEIKYKCEQFTTVSARHAAAKADKKLTFVPIVFILCRMWGTIRFLLCVFNLPTDKFRGLVYLQGIGDSAQGFANFMLFCFFTEKFQRKFLQVCCPCIKPTILPIQTSQGTSQNGSCTRTRTPSDERTSLISKNHCKPKT